MSWLNFANHFLSNQRLLRDHGSIGLFWEWCFGEEFDSECLGFFLFCFCLVRGEKVASAQDFGWQSKGEDHFGSWFPFFPYLVVTILYCSDIVWSKDLSAYFFCFLPIFDREFSFFFFCFLPIFDREVSFFAFFWSLIGNFPFSPSKGKDGHSHPGSRFMVSWDFGWRLVEQLDMIYVRALVWPTVQG